MWPRPLRAGAPGVFGYSLFEVSEADLRRLRALQLEYGRAMQSIIAGSRGTQCVGLDFGALLDLAVPEHDALSVGPSAPPSPTPLRSR